MKNKILIIDDEVGIVETLNEVFLEDGITSLKSYDGGKGISMYLAHKDEIAVIICDYKMPDVDGLDVLKKIRDIDESIPVIFYTGFGNRDILKASIRLGVYDFIEKSDIDGLVESVKRVIYSKDDEKSIEDDFKDIFDRFS